MVDTNGNIYEGCLENYLRQDKGRMIYSNKKYNEGDWLNDRMNGKVFYSWFTIEIY